MDPRALVRDRPELAEALGRVLDRRERDGRLPKSATVRDAPGLLDALRSLLSARAVRRDRDRLRLSLSVAAKALGTEGERRLEELFYAWLGRAPRDPAAEARERAAALDRALLDMAPEARTAPSRAVLREERDALARGESELLCAARDEGLGVATDRVRRLLRCIDGALANDEPVRVQSFSARVLGSSKALRWNGELLRRTGRALFEHDPWTRRAVLELDDPRSAAAAWSLAVEAHQIYYDVAAASALCFGPLVYRKEGERFDHVARHARLGECVRLVQHQLRGAELERPAALRVTLIENLTPFLDHVESLAAKPGPPEEIVIMTGGQASWAVVSLLRLLAPFRLATRHAGDLDRSGVLILRSLRRRVGRHIVPWRMDASLHRRFASRGIPLTKDERARVRALLASEPDDTLGHDLLAEIDRAGVWIEQEVFWDAL